MKNKSCVINILKKYNIIITGNFALHKYINIIKYEYIDVGIFNDIDKDKIYNDLKNNLSNISFDENKIKENKKTIILFEKMEQKKPTITINGLKIIGLGELIKLNVSNETLKIITDELNKLNINPKMMYKFIYPALNEPKDILQIGFPFKRYFFNEIHIMKSFNKLKNDDYSKRMKNNLIITKEEDYENFDYLSDMFNEKQRIKCIHKPNKISTYEFYIKNIDSICKKCEEIYGYITYYHLRETIYMMVKECTTHRLINLKCLIKRYNAKRILDPSSGWGDRLLSALSSDIELYVGIDPNWKLQKGYKKMINFFGGDKQKYKMIVGEFEKITFDEDNFDLVYSSPPYFDIEIYTTNKTQSYKKNQNEKEWIKNFLFPYIKKSFDKLKINGFFCINIEQKENGIYVNEMLKLCDQLGEKQETIYYVYIKKGYEHKVPIYIYKKINQ